MICSLFSSCTLIAVGLVQPFLVLQLCLDKVESCTIEVVVRDTMQTKRRLLFSTSFKTCSANALHVQLPLMVAKRGEWLDLVLDLEEIVHDAFEKQFKCIEEVSVGAFCCLRKIFTLRDPPNDTTDDAQLYGWSPRYSRKTESIPRIHAYPHGVMSYTQVISVAKIKAFAAACYDDTRGGGSAETSDELQGTRDNSELGVAFGRRLSENSKLSGNVLPNTINSRQSSQSSQNRGERDASSRRPKTVKKPRGEVMDMLQSFR